MTRARKYDPELLEREYIYDSSPGKGVSITDLAERHGMARSGLAEMAIKGKWYERRLAFREQLGIKTVEALGEKWVAFETATREKMMTVGLEYLDKYATALNEGEVKLSTRDMLGMAAMIRALIGDAAAAKPEEGSALIDPDATDLHPDEYRRALRSIELLEASTVDGDEPVDADEPEATGTPRTRAN